MVFYGASNRDERKFKDSSRFDVSRSAAEQLAFGIGVLRGFIKPLVSVE
jgi:cytochrome P450